VQEASEIVRHEMESAYDLDPPLKVDLGVGDNWLDAK
jgi:DNA polymerase I-like protein with 3'-5' exonuclease and polymerase domains